jgi:hypothetical protein
MHYGIYNHTLLYTGTLIITVSIEPSLTPQTCLGRFINLYIGYTDWSFSISSHSLFTKVNAGKESIKTKPPPS